MFKRKKNEKKLANASKVVAAATAIGVTAVVLLKKKNGKNNGQSKIEQIKKTVNERAGEIKSRMHNETEEKVKDVQNSAAEAVDAMDEINIAYKKAKHEMKEIATDAQKQIEAMR